MEHQPPVEYDIVDSTDIKVAPSDAHPTTLTIHPGPDPRVSERAEQLLKQRLMGLQSLRQMLELPPSGHNGQKAKKKRKNRAKNKIAKASRKRNR